MTYLPLVPLPLVGEFVARLVNVFALVPQDISKHERHHMMVRVPCQAVVDIAIVEASDVRQVGAA